jgi:hypothetical protein
MSFRTIAHVNAATSLAFGLVALIVPAALASAMGLQLGGIAEWLTRLASTAYLGYAVLAWLSRDVTDPLATRAIAAAFAASWTLGAVIAAAAVGSGLGDPRAWAFVVMQVAFAIAWSLVLVRAPLPARTA